MMYSVAAPITSQLYIGFTIKQAYNQSNGDYTLVATLICDTPEFRNLKFPIHTF